VERMRKAWEARQLACSRRRGRRRQWARRSAERAVRKGALAFLRFARARGMSCEQTAARLGLKAGTVGTWQRKWKADRMKIRPLGRTACEIEGAERWELMALFHLVGPEIGIQPLHGLFPQLSRAALWDLLHRYRRLYRRNCRDLVYALRWTVPGTVWAIDWFEPALPVDGIYHYVLLVRDLASGETIEALPCHTKDGHMAADILEALCRQFGAPLVVKSDNEFDCGPVNRVLAAHKVVQLLSPPALPPYNGSIEAGVGAIRPRAQHESIRNNRPGEWTCDDVEAARCRANQTARPFGHLRPPPELLWQNRQPPSPETRASFRRAIAQLLPQAKLDVQPKEQPALKPYQRAAARRLAISRALVALGFLRFRRKRFTPPISSQKLANIS
jgi:hypothetical protein